MAAGGREEEAGVTLVEVLVSMALLAVIGTVTAAGLTAALKATADSRDRIVAANLAAQQMDILRTVRNDELQAETTTTYQQVGQTTFTIDTVTAWTVGRSEAEACTAFAHSNGGLGRRFLEVNVEVSWPRLGNRQPVRSSSIITPAVTSYRPGLGHVAVLVRDAAGAFPAGRLVTLRRDDGGYQDTEVTSSIGCAFFADVPPGTYAVTIGVPGYVDEVDGVQQGEEQVIVQQGQTASAAFTYDRAAALELGIAGEAGGAVPPALLMTAASSSRTLAPAGGSGGRWVLDPLFPYDTGWRAWAGCAHNRPADWGGEDAAFDLDRGERATSVQVTAGTLGVSIGGHQSLAGQDVVARDVSPAVVGSPCAGTLTLGALDAGGTFVQDVALPYGDWQLSYGGRTSPVLEVRPGAPAVHVDALPASYPDSVLSGAPSLYYRLGEGAGATVAADASGNGRHGSYHGAVTLGRAGALAGDTDSAIAVDTMSERVDAGDVFDLAGRVPFTLELWTRPTIVDAQYRPLLLKEVGSSPRNGWSLWHQGEYGLGLERRVDGVQDVALTYTALTPGTWHHVAATYDGTTARIYVDGVQQTSRVLTSSLPDTSAALRVGAWPFDYVEYAGDLDEVALYERALSAEEIVAHHQAGRP